MQTVKQEWRFEAGIDLIAKNAPAKLCNMQNGFMVNNPFLTFVHSAYIIFNRMNVECSYFVGFD